AEIAEDGAFALTKPDGTSGLVSVGTVSEQMLYEIGDPQDYILPDVRCDFSDVIITADGADRVRVSTAKGAAPTPTYKTCATYADGFRTGMSLTFYGFDAAEKAKAFADAAFTRARRSLRLLNAADFAETSVEIIGAGSQIGATAAAADASEVVLKLAARHPTPLEGGVLLKEIAGLGLSTAPGLSGFQGGRAKPSPVMRLFSFLTPKEDVSIQIDVDGDETAFNAMTGVAHESARPSRPEPPAAPEDALTASVPLIALAWARSGDKGDKANIGVIARKPDYLPYLWAALSEDAVASRLAHFIEGGAENVERFFLPGA
ncbi:MAG: acyclic terpene utilization AtuA family protein, partial [Planctomycetota bacterium]